MRFEVDGFQAMGGAQTGIVALLRLEAEQWSAEDWKAHFEERAGIGARSNLIVAARASLPC